MQAELLDAKREAERVVWELEQEGERMAREHAGVRGDLESRVEASERQCEQMAERHCGEVEELQEQCGALQERLGRVQEQRSESESVVARLEGEVERLGGEVLGALEGELEKVVLGCVDAVEQGQGDLVKEQEGVGVVRQQLMQVYA